MFMLLLILIFVRPFISSLTFPYANFIYSALFLGFLTIWITIKRIDLKELRPLRYPLCAFILALAISCVFSNNITTSVKELYKYASGILLLCIGISLADKEKGKVILCITLAGLAISLIAIYQYCLGFSHLSDYAAKKSIADPFILDYISRRRPFAPFITPNALAGYLAMLLPLVLIRKNNLWSIIPVSLALLLTKSLGGLLSVLTGLTLYLYLRGNLKKKGVLFLEGLLIIIGLVWISRTAFQKTHAQPIFSAVIRLNYWRDTLEIIKLHPWAGLGLGNFNLIQSRYAHNSYLQLISEAGILGIISFLWLVIVILKSALKKIKESSYKIQAVSLLTANIVFLAHNCVDFTFFLPEISLIWWIILGLNFSRAA